MTSPHRFARSAPAVLALAVGAAAQTVLVVDGQNRAGTNFIDLPAAVAAAAPGDVIQVRSDGGTYTAFATQKPLTITADIGQATLRASATNPLAISGIPAGRQFTLRGFLIAAAGANTTPVRLANCAGRVVLQACDIGLGFPSIDVQACAGVLLQEDRVLGGFPAVAANGSVLDCVQCQVQGGAADDRFNQFSAPAVILRQSRAVLTGSQLSGGIGRNAFAPAPALDLVNSNVDAGAVLGLGSLRAGPAGVGGTGTASAVIGQSSTLRLDPAMTIAATGAVPTIVGVTAVNAQFPGLLIDTASRSFAQLLLRDIPIPQVLVLGFPGGPSAVPGIGGELWVDPSSAFVAFAVPTVVGRPNLPLGTTLAAQLAALSTTGVELSNVAMLVVR